MSQIQQLDVLILGGGMVGASLALGLAKADYSVALLERQTRDQFLSLPLRQDSQASVQDFDNRVSALTAASKQFLQKLGAWEKMEQQSISPYQEMHVWDAEGTGGIEFSAAEYYLPELGHIVENRVTLLGLYQQLVKLEQNKTDFQLLDGREIESLQFSSAKPVVRLTNGDEIHADLIVGADGANSMVRQKAGIPTREWDYQHDAIVATVETAIPHDSIARQRFMETGPLAFLPLNSPNISSIVWSMSPDMADRLMAMDDALFNETLRQHIEGQLGEVTAISDRFRFPLRQRHAKKYYDDHVVLIGDAAHTIHPLAGQGVNLGFMDASALADELTRGSKRNLVASDLSTLQRYQRRRMGANLSMAALMEGFKHLFEQDALPFRWLRNTGMRWLNQQPFLKKQIIREAMGLSMSKQSIM